MFALSQGLMRGFLRYCLKPAYGALLSWSTHPAAAQLNQLLTTFPGFAAKRSVGDFGAGGGLDS